MPHRVRPRLEKKDGSEASGIAGWERVAQTEVRQDGADYNRCSGEWKDFLPLGIMLSAYPDISCRGEILPDSGALHFCRSPPDLRR